MIRQFVIWGGISVLLLLLKVFGPIVWIETSCSADPVDQNYKSLITKSQQQRDEARSYLTYPEWHIVYAYQEMGQLLETSDEHAFNYWESIKGFWTSLCDLNQESDRHGGSPGMKSTVYTIGASFTLEMAVKALVEETIGRATAVWRGDHKTPQDDVSAEMMKDYALFLHQVPWYQYDFAVWIDKLWAAPVTDFVRSWERRLTLGTEWMAKIGYASLIGQAVESVGHDELTMHSIVAGLSAEQLSKFDGVKVIGAMGESVHVETPRYQAFTDLVPQMLQAGGAFVEIAGNDDMLVTATGPVGATLAANDAWRVITKVGRQGFGNQRLLVDVKVTALVELFAQLKAAGFAVEHLHDY
jgi:hypothetical protein